MEEEFELVLWIAIGVVAVEVSIVEVIIIEVMIVIMAMVVKLVEHRHRINFLIVPQIMIVIVKEGAVVGLPLSFQPIR